MRQSRQAQLAAISKNVTYDDGSLAVTTVGSIQEGMRRVDEIADMQVFLATLDPSTWDPTAFLSPRSLTTCAS